MNGSRGVLTRQQKKERFVALRSEKKHKSNCCVRHLRKQVISHPLAYLASTLACTHPNPTRFKPQSTTTFPCSSWAQSKSSLQHLG